MKYFFTTSLSLLTILFSALSVANLAIVDIIINGVSTAVQIAGANLECKIPKEQYIRSKQWSFRTAEDLEHEYGIILFGDGSRAGRMKIGGYKHEAETSWKMDPKTRAITVLHKNKETTAIYESCERTLLGSYILHGRATMEDSPNRVLIEVGNR